MPSKLPVVTSKKAVKAFSKARWHVARQKGGHIHLVKPGEKAILTIPSHSKPLKRVF
jgi:predicted RNA binding protein YcfA (HicA-like mRNA interferase family)